MNDLEYTVLSTIIQQRLSEEGDAEAPLKILGFTKVGWEVLESTDGKADSVLSPCEILNLDLPQIDGLETGTLMDFLRKNSRPFPLEKMFNLRIPYEILSISDSQRIVASSDPFEFGHLELSRVGLGSGNNQALAYVADQDVMGGEGSFYLLRAERGIWRVVSDEPVWIS